MNFPITRLTDQYNASMDDEIMRVKVGQGWVGMVGLKSIFDELRDLDIKAPEVLSSRLLERARRSNYIAPSAESEYRSALLREYRLHLGLPVEEESAVPEILILGPGCSNCDELKSRVFSAAAEIGLQADIRPVKEADEIGRYGLVSLPALVVNGRLVSTGRVPSVEELKTLLS
jgi:small redox-active disulfide protein 2